MELNPYESANEGFAEAKRNKQFSLRWLALPFFIIGGAVVCSVALFLAAILFVSGDFFFEVAVSLGFVGLIVGAVVGTFAGVTFALGGRTAKDG